MSDNLAVVSYAKLPHMTLSFQGIHTVCLLKGLLETDCDTFSEAYLAIGILHPAVIQKIDISDSRAVIGYVEGLHTTGSFPLRSVSTHKMLYRKVVAFRVWTHNSRIVSRIQLYRTE